MGEIWTPEQRPLYKELLWTPEQVNTRIDELADEIGEKYEGQDPTFVILLFGGYPFGSKLAFAIASQRPHFHPKVDVMIISAYGNEREAGEARLVLDLSRKFEVHGRPAIIIDDLGHTNRSMIKAKEHLLDFHKVSSVETAVLVDRLTTHKVGPGAEYVGFTFKGEDWLTGMGLDDIQGVGIEGNRWHEWIAIANDSPELPPEANIGRAALS